MAKMVKTWWGMIFIFTNFLPFSPSFRQVSTKFRHFAIYAIRDFGNSEKPPENFIISEKRGCRFTQNQTKVIPFSLDRVSNLANAGSPRRKSEPLAIFVSRVGVYATSAMVTGVIPTCGILSKMSECARTEFTHSLARNLPSVGGSNLGRLPYSQGAYPSRKPGSSRRYRVVRKMATKEACLAAFMVRKSDTVNSQRLVRDFRKIVGKSRTTQRPSGRPSFCAPVADADASFSGPFPPQYRIA